MAGGNGQGANLVGPLPIGTYDRAHFGHLSTSVTPSGASPDKLSGLLAFPNRGGIP